MREGGEAGKEGQRKRGGELYSTVLIGNNMWKRKYSKIVT